MQDMTIISYTMNDDGRSYRVSLDLSNPIQFNTSGLALLIQKTVMWLLKTPGQDYFEPELGGGFNQLARPQMWSDSRDTIASGIIEAIAAVESQMKKRQLGINRPDNEKLASLGLMAKKGIFFIEDERGFMINLELKNQAGERAQFAVPIIAKES